MGYRQIIKSVDYGNLSPEQTAKLQKVLQERKAKLEAALAEVDEVLQLLGGKRKKAPKKKKKAAKRR